ncbi:unnamed protein product, partial [Brenthis ino]
MMVLKVKNFCEREKRNNAPLIPLRCVQARVAAITGVSEKTVSKITKEGEVAASTSTKVSTPRKSGPGLKKSNWMTSNGQEANKIVQITEEAFATITEEEWRKECEHVKKVEEKYYADGPVIDSEMERFIIEVGDDSDTSDDEDDEEDEVDDDLSGISPLDEHFLIDHNYNKKY